MLQYSLKKKLKHTVLAFSRRILKLWSKINSISKSTFPGLLKNFLTFNPRWLEGRVVVAHTFGKVFAHPLVLFGNARCVFYKWICICVPVSKTEAWSVPVDVAAIFGQDMSICKFLTNSQSLSLRWKQKESNFVKNIPFDHP